jgi:RHS repeat-associated protein
VQKITPSATTTYIHDAKGELAMEVSTAAPTASGTEYLTADTLGSTRLITDASGNPQRCIDYLPFGEEIPAGENGRTGPCYESLGSANTAQYPAPPDVADQKFTGKERDAETGLDFFGARYFSSAQGRFTSPDWSAKPEPIPYTDSKDPQSLNLYAYVRNNPLKNRDLDGHWCVFGVVGTSCTPPPPPPAPPPGPPAQLMQPNGGHQQVNYRPGVPPAAGHLQNLVQCIGECARTPLTVTSTSEHMEGAHGPDTPHGRGEAADLAARSPQQADHLVGCAAQCGAGFALNEVRHPSPHATGPHVHVQVGPGLGGSRGDLPAAPQEDQ